MLFQAKCTPWFSIELVGSFQVVLFLLDDKFPATPYNTNVYRGIKFSGGVVTTGSDDPIPSYTAICRSVTLITSVPKTILIGYLFY